MAGDGWPGLGCGEGLFALFAFIRRCALPSPAGGRREADLALREGDGGYRALYATFSRGREKGSWIRFRVRRGLSSGMQNGALMQTDGASIWNDASVYGVRGKDALSCCPVVSVQPTSSVVTWVSACSNAAATAAVSVPLEGRATRKVREATTR